MDKHSDVLWTSSDELVRQTEVFQYNKEQATTLSCPLSSLVSDPFVGGGTVVLEAMRAGRLGVGADISPLALFVSRGRCWTASDSELERLKEVRREEKYIIPYKNP